MTRLIQILALVFWMVFAFLTLYVLFTSGPDFLVIVSIVVVALIGYIMLQSGLKALKAGNLTPERTVNQLSRDAAAAKETVR